MQKWDGWCFGLPPPAVGHSYTLGEGKNFASVWEPLDSLHSLKMISKPSSKLGVLTASALSGAPAPATCPLLFPFLCLPFPSSPLPPGEGSHFGEGQSFGPSVLVTGSLGCGGRALAHAGGMSCACFVSPCTS